jgi:hypothetical protein
MIIVSAFHQAHRHDVRNTLVISLQCRRTRNDFRSRREFVRLLDAHIDKIRKKRYRHKETEKDEYQRDFADCKWRHGHGLWKARVCCIMSGERC